MENCLVSKLKVSVNNENLPYFNSMRLKFKTGAFALGSVSGETLQFKVEKGTITRDGSTYNVGDIVDVTSTTTFNIPSLPSQIRILDNDTLSFVAFSFSQEPMNVADFAAFINASIIRINAEVSNTEFTGRVEDYVERTIAGGKTNEVTVNGNYITFNGNSETSQKYRIVYSIDDVKVYLRGSVTTTEALVGTYNKTTKTWSYE